MGAVCLLHPVLLPPADAHQCNSWRPGESCLCAATCTAADGLIERQSGRQLCAEDDEAAGVAPDGGKRVLC